MAGLINRMLYKITHLFFILSLVSIIAMTLLKQNVELSGEFILAFSIITGCLITLAYIRVKEIRNFLTIFFSAIFIFPYLFLFDSSVEKVVFPEESYRVADVEIKNPVPIVMVVFDEFCLTSIMNEERKIDEIRYPNFAALAEDFYWFRNATTVSDNTLFAVPSILTARYPEPTLLPTNSDHPENLFTLLGNTYEINGFETHTLLCPETLCQRKSIVFSQRISSMLVDLSLIYLHIILPTDLTGGLPVVTQTWKNFWNKNNIPSGEETEKDKLSEKINESYKDRSRLFERFIESITPSDNPTFHFLHIMLPHVPYEYLPSGRTYNYAGIFTGTDASGKWSNKDWAMVSDYQRYLLQLGFVDKLLGRLIRRLKDIGIYVRSLIIVTADHGVSYRPGDLRRNITRTNFQDIMPVPLFIKKPDQHHGVISDRNVETIDILPTIADILNIDLKWLVDGHSVFDDSLSERKDKVIFHNNAQEQFVVASSALEAKYATLNHMIELFGSKTSDGIFKVGHHTELIGRPVSNLWQGGNSDIGIIIKDAFLYENINPSSSFIPVHIIGQVLQDAGIKKPLKLAVSINGIIAAVTQTFKDLKRKTTMFSTIVPELAFRKGKNRIEVFVIYNKEGRALLARTRNQSVTYSLGHETITTSLDRIVKIVPHELKGGLDSVRVEGDSVIMGGWAADVKNEQLPEAILIFVNGEFFYSGGMGELRPDLVKAFKNEVFLEAGFRYKFPLRVFEDFSHSEIRVLHYQKKV